MWKFTLYNRKNSYGEYVIRAYKDGKYNEEATYYTDDWDDAVGTLRALAASNGREVIVHEAEKYETSEYRTWKSMYFGKVTRAEIREAVNDRQWQNIRIGMKSVSKEEKQRLLSGYYERTYEQIREERDLHKLRMLQVRVTNYITALARGGILKQEEYR